MMTQHPEGQPARFPYRRHAHEVLFSLNLSLVGLLTYSLNGTFDISTGLGRRLNTYAGLHLHSNLGPDIAFFALGLLLASSLFLILRLSSNTAVASGFLRWVAGFSSLLALPAHWLYSIHLSPQPPGLPDPPPLWLVAELAAAAACAAVYVYARWPLPAWLNVGLLVLHFGFWGWLFLGGPYFWLAPFQSVFPLAGLCSALAWGLYVSRQRPKSRLGAPAVQDAN